MFYIIILVSSRCPSFLDSVALIHADGDGDDVGLILHDTVRNVIEQTRVQRISALNNRDCPVNFTEAPTGTNENNATQTIPTIFEPQFDIEGGGSWGNAPEILIFNGWVGKEET